MPKQLSKLKFQEDHLISKQIFSWIYRGMREKEKGLEILKEKMIVIIIIIITIIMRAISIAAALIKTHRSILLLLKLIIAM